MSTPAVALSTANTTHRWGTQTAYATAVVPTRRFGTDTEVDFDTAPTSIDLQQAGARTLEGYTAGTDMETITTKFAMTHPWWWGLVLAKVTKTGSEAPYTHKFEKQNTPVSYTHEARVNGAVAGDTSNTSDYLKGEDLKYIMRGCVVDSVDIACSKDQVAAVTLNSLCGNISTSNAAFAAFANDDNPDTYTYSFRYGGVTVKEGNSATPVELLQVKDIRCKITTGQTQEEAFGFANAQSTLPGTLRYSGSLTHILINQKMLDLVIKRKVLTELVLMWHNGLSGGDLRSITLKFSNVLLFKHKTGFGKVNRIDNMLDFRATDLIVEAKSGSATTLK